MSTSEGTQTMGAGLVVAAPFAILAALAGGGVPDPHGDGRSKSKACRPAAARARRAVRA
ncbi:hypothetical protein FB565_008294 [Actinoplanes lutulentus]|uniref:Uncharacterized protein n=1 Tax=Actinoplanes lutulentus TaxID=1287878 RepID=A0A327Z8H9_9ACTN|nr:hypothetical protein [Actinoplanes lutulentus]MBB2948511.1 hypothetical protein [Actinoplanes lutulentus]RAK34457.1 hypothetical protein B0I29_11156 [Actinoplanes lutulentus]